MQRMCTPSHAPWFTDIVFCRGFQYQKTVDRPHQLASGYGRINDTKFCTLEEV